MTAAGDHIAFRTVEGREAYLPGTGLTVWEIAWIAQGYEGDVEATARHLEIECALVQEALVYAADHQIEIETQIHEHVSWTADEIARLLPRARGIKIPPEPAGPSTPWLSPACAACDRYGVSPIQLPRPEHRS
ncbi:MAG TPA: hypothetical protein VKX16_19510 [Chloroflexota bacterium]|nr:hypothetical protein [Chloroflexota bacterium]